MNTVLYHADCNDGFCAAWVVKQLYPDAEFIPVRYGDPAPKVRGELGILDFSYPPEELTRLCELADHVTVIDHHKTAVEKLTDFHFDNLTLILDVTQSGAMLTWRYLHGDVEPHWLVRYTQDRDLWQHRLPDTHAVNAALSAYPHDFAVWDMLSTQQPTMLAIKGEGIILARDQIVRRHVERAVIRDIGGYNVLAVNATVYQSEIAGELARSKPFGATWMDIGDKRIWSLRSTAQGVDVSEVAKSLGGGGHRNAAGFEERL